MVAIPKGFLEQYGVSAEMPRTQAVTRGAPPMRSPVLRDASKYQLKYVPYTDPQMVANVEMAKGRIWGAVTKGVIQLGETFAAADASSQYTTAWTNFNLEAHGQLDFLKNQPLTRETSTVVGNQLVTDDEPTHVQLQSTLHKGLLQQRDRWAKTIQDPKARQQFLQNSISTVVSLQKQAAETARNKHILFLQGESIKHFEGALTVERIEQLVLEPHMQLIWSPKELLGFKDKYIKRLVFNERDMQVRIAIDNNDLEGLSNFRQGLLTGKVYDSAQKKWFDDPHAKYLGNYKEERDALFGLIKAGEDAIEAGAVKEGKKRFATDLASIYTNPAQFTLDALNAKAITEGWTQSQITAANNAWRHQFDGPLESDTDLRVDIAQNIKDWDVEKIFGASDRLTKAHLEKALQLRADYESGIEDWRTTTTGKKAIDTLKRIHGVDVSGGLVFTMSGMSGPSESQKATDAFNIAFLELEQEIEDLPVGERADKAWELVKALRDDHIKNHPSNKKKEPDTDKTTTTTPDSAAPASSDASAAVKGIDRQHHYEAQQFATDNAKADGTAMTLQVARNLPIDYPGRATIIKQYQDWGATFTETELKGLPTDANTAAASGMSLDEWYHQWTQQFDKARGSDTGGGYVEKGPVLDHGTDTLVTPPKAETVIPHTHQKKKEEKATTRGIDTTSSDKKPAPEPTPAVAHIAIDDPQLDVLVKDYVIDDDNFFPYVVFQDGVQETTITNEVRNRLYEISVDRNELYSAELMRPAKEEGKVDVGFIFYAYDPASAKYMFMDFNEYKTSLIRAGVLQGKWWVRFYERQQRESYISLKNSDWFSDPATSPPGAPIGPGHADPWNEEHWIWWRDRRYAIDAEQGIRILR